MKDKSMKNSTEKPIQRIRLELVLHWFEKIQLNYTKKKPYSSVNSDRNR